MKQAETFFSWAWAKSAFLTAAPKDLVMAVRRFAPEYAGLRGVAYWLLRAVLPLKVVLRLG